MSDETRDSALDVLYCVANYLCSHDREGTAVLVRAVGREYGRMRNEIERLRSLLASQPRTKDGKIVVDGMGLYPAKDRRGFDDDIMQCHAVTQANWIRDDGQTWTDDPSEFYSEPQQQPT